MDVHVLGVGKDQYNEYLDQMVDGRILPLTEDSQSEGYPVWTDWEASQRSAHIQISPTLILLVGGTG